ncbi:MAG: tetratricopeptide repeat protein [Chloroflexota bacterium]
MPQDAELRQAWAAYGAGQYRQAVQQLEAALRSEADSVEAHYLLGLSLMRLGERDQAAGAFEQVAELARFVTNSTRAAMVRRLALAHVNRLRRGTWDFEEAIWRGRP